MRVLPRFAPIVLYCAVVIGCSSSANRTDSSRNSARLPSWNDAPAKKAIVDFVAKTTTKGSPEFVEPAERIAVFDNDETLWCEQPMFPQP